MNVTFPKKEFFALVVLIVLGIAASFIPQPKSPAVPTQNGTDEFAGWQTYRNEEYGFEFRYPSNYQFDTQNNQLSYNSTEKNFLLKVLPSKGVRNFTWGRISENFVFDSTAQRWKNTQNNSFLDSTTKTETGVPIYTYSVGDPGVGIVESLVFDAQNDTLVLFSFFLYYPHPDNNVVMPSSPDLERFTGWEEASKITAARDNEILEEFQQILSTFRFVE